jgi:hypothetical protein
MPSVFIFSGLSPTATVLLRGPTGRTSWTVELRQIPDCKKVRHYFAVLLSPFNKISAAGRANCISV